MDDQVVGLAVPRLDTNLLRALEPLERLGLKSSHGGQSSRRRSLTCRSNSALTARKTRPMPRAARGPAVKTNAPTRSLITPEIVAETGPAPAVTTLEMPMNLPLVALGMKSGINGQSAAEEIAPPHARTAMHAV